MDCLWAIFLQIRIAADVLRAFPGEAAHPKFSASVFASAASTMFNKEKTMSARDLPATVRAMSVIVAVALVASAFAPILFAAARVVA
jgi:hypothetical protein